MRLTPPKFPDQLPLHLPFDVARARDDLIVGSTNSSAIDFLDMWPDWPSSVIVLTGPSGSGKSHLSHIWASRSGATFIDAPTHFDSSDLHLRGNIVVEDLLQGSFSEAWLFHLLNIVRSRGSFLLLTSRRHFSRWGVSLPDLSSRLKASHCVELGAPDDVLLSGVLTKLFADRQLLVEPPVIDYMLHRMERSLAFALDVVSRLDSAALANKRAVTRPLAGRILNEMNGTFELSGELENDQDIVTQEDVI